MLNVLSASVAFGLMVTSIFVRDRIDPNLVALALVYCMQLMGLGSFTVKLFVTLESNLTSVERLANYLEVPQEGGTETWSSAHEKDIDTDWPQSGSITVSKLQMRYRPNLPLVLKGIDISIKSGEKIGVCGRTGAGKSSLVSLIQRLKPQTCSPSV